MNKVIGIESRQNWQFYRTDQGLRGEKRMWIPFSHTYRGSEVNGERLFVEYLDNLGKR